MPLGNVTFGEIMSQPERWREALELLEASYTTIRTAWDQNQYERVLLTGCGSTYYLGVIGASLFKAQMDIDAAAYTASELMLYPEAYLKSNKRTLLICLSRSSETRETVEAARLFKKYGNGHVVVITNHSENPLAQEADFLLQIDSAREESRVQTRSFSSMAITLHALIQKLVAPDKENKLDQLPEIVERLLSDYAQTAKEWGSIASIRQFIFLGSGALYGVAAEAMLKTAELSRLPCTIYHTLEVLHGPRYTVNHNTMVIALVNESLMEEEIRTLDDLRKRGAKILSVVESDPNNQLSKLGYVIELQSGLPLLDRVILYLPILQLIAFHQARLHGFDPDKLGKVNYR